MEPLATFTDEDVLANDPLTLEEDNFFTMLQRGVRGSARSCEGTEPEQESESPFPGLLSTHTFPVTF